MVLQMERRLIKKFKYHDYVETLQCNVSICFDHQPIQELYKLLKIDVVILKFALA